MQDILEEQHADLQLQVGVSTHELCWPRSQTLLDTMLEAGIDAPHSCKVGKCGACVCTVSDGEVSVGENEVLSDDDLAEGYILACQARPVTKRIKIEF